MVRHGNPRRGFTLLELIIVMAIIGILAAVAIPSMKDTPRRAQEAVLKTDLRAMRDVIDQFYADNGHYPPSLDAVVEKDYLRRIPVDPITKSADTWVLEYQDLNPEEEPAETDLPEDGQPGVIDVHSGSTAIALDGTAYSEW